MNRIWSTLRNTLVLIFLISFVSLLLASCSIIQAPPTTTSTVLPKPGTTVDGSIDRIVSSMRWGNIAFNAPESINLYNTAQIQLLLSLDQSIEELQKKITAAGQEEGATVLVGDRMQAELTGPNFQITAITPEEQAITSKGITEWKWEVKPLIPGRHYLHLTLNALFIIDGVASQRSIRTFDRAIEVKITWTQRIVEFLRNYWQWIWTAILLPIAVWLWKKWMNRKQKSKSSDSS